MLLERVGPGGHHKAALITVAAALRSCPFAAPAPAAEKQIAVQQQTMFDPVLISEVAFRGTALQCGLPINRRPEYQPVVPFEAGDDWLQDLTIQLLNRTERTIVYVQVALYFPEAGSGGRMRAHYVALGRVPANANYSLRTGEPLMVRTEEQPMSLAPGRTMIVRVGDQIDLIRRLIEGNPAGGNVPLASITKCRIHIAGVYFENGMRWLIGGYSVPDPDHHGKFNDMDETFFPGGRGRYWRDVP